MKHSKIAIVGAGRVGATIAYALMLKNLTAEILLADADSQRCKGELLDLSDVLSFSVASQIQVASLKRIGMIADIIIITASSASQKLGESRIELLEQNKKVISSIIKDMQPINPHAIIIIVTNPVDLLTLQAQTLSDLARSQVFGSGTLLDSTRFQLSIAQKAGVAEESVQAYILGEHGDTQFPALSSAQISGIPLLHFSEMTEADLLAMAQVAKQKADEIIRGKEATFFGVASCMAMICESIIFNQKRVIPVSCYNEQYDVCMSMPAIIGERGIEKVLSIPFNAKEKKLFKASAQYLQKQKLKILKA